MRTVFPKKPARDFNEWMGYIKSEIDKSNGVKVKEEKREEEESYANTYEGSRQRLGSPWFI
jgi:hypothetical protein